MGIRGAIKKALDTDSSLSSSHQNYSHYSNTGHQQPNYQGYGQPCGHSHAQQPTQWDGYGQQPAYGAPQHQYNSQYYQGAPPEQYGSGAHASYGAQGYDNGYGYGSAYGTQGHPDNKTHGGKGSKLTKALFGSSSDWGLGSGSGHSSSRHDDWGMGLGYGSSSGKMSKSDKKALKMMGKLMAEGDGGDGGGDGGGGGGGDGGGGGV